MKDLPIYRYIKYEQEQGLNPRHINNLFLKAREAKQKYREAMRNVITLPPVDPMESTRTAECWRFRAQLFYQQIHEKIWESLEN